MNWFQRLDRSMRNDLSHWPPVRAQPALEGLETRLAPANVFVVPVSQPADSAHFHTLAEALVGAGSSGMVTIEPGASPDSMDNVTVTQDFITIQGDPNVPASILPSYDLEIDGGNVLLRNLNLGSLTLGTQAILSAFDTVSKCMIHDVTSSAPHSFLTQNTVTGTVAILGFLAGTERLGGDTLSNNAFTSTALTPWLISSAPGTLISDNTFYATSHDFQRVSLEVLECGVFDSRPTTIANNSFI